MAWQTRVIHLVDVGMAGQELRHFSSVGILPFDAQSQCFHPAQKHVARHWGQGGSVDLSIAVDLFFEVRQCDSCDAYMGMLTWFYGSD